MAVNIRTIGLLKYMLPIYTLLLKIERNEAKMNVLARALGPLLSAQNT